MVYAVAQLFAGGAVVAVFGRVYVILSIVGEYLCVQYDIAVELGGGASSHIACYGLLKYD